jgi:hypothetical protein
MDMNPSSHNPVAGLILEDLAPVRRIARPWRRAVPAWALGLLMAVAVYLVLGVRKDAAALGATVLWGLSAAQMAYGLVLIAAALRSAVPGRGPARRRTALLLLAGAAVVIAVTWTTWLTHASLVPPGHQRLYWAVCLRTPLVIGLPALILTLFLAFRAYPTRPLLTGALAGLGAGLLSDGSWRTFCEVSDPGHVLTSHAVSVVLLAVAGMALSAVASRRAGATPSSARASR